MTPYGATGGWRRGIPILEMGLALAPLVIYDSIIRLPILYGYTFTSRNPQRFLSEKVSPVGG